MVSRIKTPDVKRTNSIKHFSSQDFKYTEHFGFVMVMGSRQKTPMQNMAPVRLDTALLQHIADIAGVIMTFAASTHVV